MCKGLDAERSGASFEARRKIVNAIAGAGYLTEPDIVCSTGIELAEARRFIKQLVEEYEIEKNKGESTYRVTEEGRRVYLDRRNLPMKRKCMCCGNDFDSVGAGNRVCKECSLSIELGFVPDGVWTRKTNPGVLPKPHGLGGINGGCP